MKGMSLENLKEVFAEDLAALTEEEKAEAAAAAAGATNPEEEREQRLANLLEKARKEVEASGYDPYAHKATKGLAKQVLNKYFGDYQLVLKIDYDNCRNLLKINLFDRDLIDPENIFQEFTLLGNSEEEFNTLLKELRGPTPEERAELLALEKKAVEEAAKNFTDYISDKNILSVNTDKIIIDLGYQVFIKKGEALGASSKLIKERQEHLPKYFFGSEDAAEDISKELRALLNEINSSISWEQLKEEEEKYYNNIKQQFDYYYNEKQKIESAQKAENEKNQQYLFNTICVKIVDKIKEHFGELTPEILEKINNEEAHEELSSIVKSIVPDGEILYNRNWDDNVVLVKIPYKNNDYYFVIVRDVGAWWDDSPLDGIEYGIYFNPDKFPAECWVNPGEICGRHW